jgi:hypothetical protein
VRELFHAGALLDAACPLSLLRGSLPPTWRE